MMNENSYPGMPGIHILSTTLPAKEILSKDFPNRQWPISGGWGYSIEDAVVLEHENHDEAVHFEYEFVEYRTYEEAVISRPREKLAGFKFDRKNQTLVSDKNKKKYYDVIEISVSAYLEKDYKFLMNDWDQHSSYENDVEGKQRHLALAESKRIQYDVVCWFDITRFFQQ